MKLLVVLLAFVALSLGTPLKWQPNPPRRYLPEEDDPYRTKYLWYIDDNGKFYFEDLTKTVPQPRATADDLTLHLYTRQNLADGVSLKLSNVHELNDSDLYDPKKHNYFLVHGWNNDYQSNFNVLNKIAILEKEDANVFVVDWGRTANKLYLTSFGAVQPLGEYLGDFINDLIEDYGMSPEKIRLIGHSLGAHLAGCAGARINGLVDYIVGLDPAGPLFSLRDTENRLDETDARFVQIIHTSGTLLGFESAIGHADYFPNGGSGQPGCGLDLIGTCAHSRAYYYFEESIRLGGFASVQCQSYKAYKKGQCEKNQVSSLGTLAVDKSATGDYYLYTNKQSPYAQD